MGSLTRPFRNGWLEITFDFLACALVLATHFTNYIVYVGYGRIAPDLFVVYGGLLLAAGGITLLLQVPSIWGRTVLFSILLSVAFADAVFQFGTQGEGVRLGLGMVALGSTMILVFFLRRHISKIICVVFATMLLSTLWSAASSHTAPADKQSGAGAGAPSNLSVVVHVVLDEHAGLAALNDDVPGGKRVRELLTGFYLRNGFRLFPRAFSQSVETRDSLGSLFNGIPVADAESVIVRERDKLFLTSNGYLGQWGSQGYKIDVLQSSYLDFCRGAGGSISRCDTYLHDGYDTDSLAGMPALDRVSLIFQMYGSSVSLVKLARLAVRRYAGRIGFDGGLPAGPTRWVDRVGPLAAMSPLDGLIDRLRDAMGGKVYFAHLLMPHYPYVYDPGCQVRTPVSAWQMRSDENWTNTPESRKQRYALYFQQIECTVMKLQQLFDAMKERGVYDNAVIVIHGDHGSRITRFKPEPENRARMELADYLDGFSTLFVCKGPTVPSGIDTRMLPLSALLAECVGGAGRATGADSVPKSEVCLADDHGKCLMVGLPSFPELDQ